MLLLFFCMFYVLSCVFVCIMCFDNVPEQCWLSWVYLSNMDPEIIERFFADSGSEGEDADEDVDVESFYDEEEFFLEGLEAGVEIVSNAIDMIDIRSGKNLFRFLRF